MDSEAENNDGFARACADQSSSSSDRNTYILGVELWASILDPVTGDRCDSYDRDAEVQSDFLLGATTSVRRDRWCGAAWSTRGVVNIGCVIDLTDVDRRPNTVTEHDLYYLHATFLNRRDIINFCKCMLSTPPCYDGVIYSRHKPVKKRLVSGRDRPID